MENTVKNYKEVLSRVENAAKRVGRNPEEITIVAVAKTFSHEIVKTLAPLGEIVIGENRVQEAALKKETLKDLPFKWHMIGHLQRNKANKAAEIFDMVHSAHSLKLLEKLERKCEQLSKELPVLIEVNLSGEETKSGCKMEDLNKMLDFAVDCKYIKIKGFMTIPPFFDDPEKVRPFFKQLRQLRNEYAKRYGSRLELNDLSMGMTNDFEVAIEEGATYVRIGTAIFGLRSCALR